MKKIIISLFLILGSSLYGKNIVLDKKEFIIEYSSKYKGPVKVSYTIDKKVNELNLKKRPKFYKDPSLDIKIATVPEDFTNTGFDRGHLAPDANFDYDEEVLNKTYSMANITPQYPNVNRKIWASLEELERYTVSQFGSLYVENIVIYGNERLQKLPIEEILKGKTFKDEKHLENYKNKQLKATKELEKKNIYLPKAFIKKFKQKNFEECFYVPNKKDLNISSIDLYRVSCKGI